MFMELVCKSDDVNLRDVLRFSNLVKSREIGDNGDNMRFYSSEALLKFVIGSKLKCSSSDVSENVLSNLENFDVASNIINSDEMFRIGKFQLKKDSKSSQMTCFNVLSEVQNLPSLEAVLGCVSTA